MNNKRQTIWLVSMLSLMVILSAYYLFSEDVGTGTGTKDIVTTDGTQQQGLKSDATEASGAASGDDNGIIANEVTVDGANKSGDKGATNGTGSDSSGSTKATDGKKGTSGKTDAATSDEDVLKEFTATGGVATSVFSQLQEQRDETFNEQYNKLMGKVSDTKLNDKDAASSMAMLDQLEDSNSKMTGLEEELSKQFGNAAVVTDARNHYKIVVQSDKLERSQADSILTMAMGELNLTPDQLTIQYVK